MIDPKDLNIANRSLTEEQRNNLFWLANKLERLEAKFGSLFKFTSGFRTPEDQIHIYAEKGITDISKVPMHSQHLNGNAVDIYDGHKNLQAFLLTEKGLEALEEIGFWCERFEYCQKITPWVHLQQVAPPSGHRFFIPYPGPIF